MLTVVTVAHRSADELAVLLPTLPPDAEVIVVDTDGSAAGAAATVVERHDNPGFGAANNDGVARAGGEVTVLLNPDIVATPGAVDRLATLAAGREGLVVPRLRNADGSVQRSAFALPGRASGVLTAITPGPLRREPWRSRAPRIVGWALARGARGANRAAAAPGPVRPRRVPVLRGHGPVPARARGRRADGAAPGGRADAHRRALLRRGADRRARPPPREVVGANLGERALRWDDAAQIAEYGVRSWRGRDRARLRAVLHARG
jgi:hypothetical protein